MPRYFLELAYNGTRLNGWQRQDNAPSVQAAIEDALRLILRQPMLEIVGCGRTDTGVHASAYFAHFDFEGEFPASFLERANKLVGLDIVLKGIHTVEAQAHTRFDATRRSYNYYIGFQKNPFARETEWHFPHAKRLDREKMQKTADLLRGYKAFAPFCKTNSDAQTMLCDLSEAEWIFTDNGAIFTISSNRFLRGMVRLVVGACINVGLGQISLADVKYALDTQTPLVKSYSVPPMGLFLSRVIYPYAL
ncbi:MAG: tRNA pseudouridine synthase A [Saprospiraceae bacterium]|nr:tRNA pseudouridine synthase A [Saprospiraceae bacterium]